MKSNQDVTAGKFRTYRCEWCKEQFDSDWSDAEANAEAEQYFGVIGSSQKPEIMAVVCDDCFQKMHPEKYPELTQEARRRLSDD